MKNWFRLHLLALTRTLGVMVRQPVSSGFNLLVIGIAASFPLALWLLVSSLSQVVGQVPVEPQISIYAKTDASPDELAALKKAIASDVRVASSRFVSKDEALKGLQAHFGNTDLIAGLPENPLPDAIVVKARDNAPEVLEKMRADFAAKAGVDDVQLDSAWARRLARITALGHTLFEVVAILLGLALVLITGNAIRMQILTRRDEIEVAKLIGATDAFIRRPFFYSAVLQGVLGGLVAVGMVVAMLAHVNPAVRELATAYGQQFELQTPDIATILTVCGVCALLCLSGAWVAVARHLRNYR